MTQSIDDPDKKAIISHIDGLFQAYIQKDAKAIREGHTSDWKGFQIRSDRLVKGIAEYMNAATSILENMNVIRYRILDIDIEIHNNLGIVYYLAEVWKLTKEEEEISFRLRSVDIYRKETKGWNQCGSNICVVPS